MDISRLEAMGAHKRTEVAADQAARPLQFVRDQALRQAPCRDFLATLRGAGIAVIAEIKKASPAAGVISDTLNAGALARRYVAGGAGALSVWTDKRFFNGDGDLLRQARAAVSVPVLRKDIILDPYQLYESRAMGADAVLLIAALLDVATLRALIHLSGDLGLAAPVDVHRESDVDRAVAAGAKAIFIHNRDVTTFQVDLGTTLRLRPRIPRGIVVVSESGIGTAADVIRLRDYVDGVLVGTALMEAEKPEEVLRELVWAGKVATRSDGATEGR